MKILIIGVEKEYNAEFFYKKAFSQLGHEVGSINEYEGIKRPLKTRILHTRTSVFSFDLYRLQINKNIEKFVKEFEPDIIIVFKGELLSKKSLEFLSQNYKIYLFYPDVYKFKPVLRERLHYFNAVFTAANKVAPYLDLGAKRVITIPWACDPEIHRDLSLQKIFPISFIGTAYWERRKIIKQIKFEVATFGDFWGKWKNWSYPAVYGDNYIKTINQTLINLNLQATPSILGDAPTMRTFELAGSGGFQISDYMPTLKEYFPKLVTFQSIDEMNELIAYYIDDVEQAEHIANSCQSICYKRFKYTDSSKQILENL